MSEHTPTPWFKGRKFEVGPRPSTDDQSDGMLCPVADVYGDNREADAAFIVKAVNSHDALVEALHEARMALFKIRACSIVGCEQGYGKPELWADALFASHGDVAKALKTIDAALTQPASAVGGSGNG